MKKYTVILMCFLAMIQTMVQECVPNDEVNIPPSIDLVR